MTKQSANGKRPPLKVSKDLLEQANDKGVRNWVFTWHNSTVDDENFLKGLKTRWLIFGREKCPTTGTPHLQGALIFTHQTPFSRLNKLTKKKCIWAPMVCPVAYSDGYCRKDHDFFESGPPPVSKEKQQVNTEEKWEAIWDSAKKGDFEAVPAHTRVTNYNALKRIQADYLQAPLSLNELDNEWIYSTATGTGKTFPFEQMRDELRNCFFKTHDNVWQDYRGEPVVVLDEFELHHKGMYWLLKQWMGKGVIEAKVLFSGGKFRPKRVIVTSNHHPRVIWPNQDISPLYRRMRIYKQISYDVREYEDTGFYTPVTNEQWSPPYEDPLEVFGTF